MTRSVARKIGDAVHVELPHTTGRAKKTKIPPGIGLEQIPSPGNLKLKKGRGRGRAGVVKKLDFDALAEGLNEMDLGKKGKGKAKAKGEEKEELEEMGVATDKQGNSRGKGKNENKEKEAEVTTEGIDVAPSRPTRATRSNPTASKPAALRTRKASGAIAQSEPETGPEPLILNPIVPPGLKLSAAHIKRTGRPMKRSHSIVDSSFSSSASTSHERVGTAEDKTRGLVLSFREKMSETLWEVDEGDVDKLKETIDKEQGDTGLLKSMLEVVEKFQAFRDCLDGFLEEVDLLGLGLDWGGDGDKEGEGDE
jgi:hypothetical protein